jgi:hypothetical protein
MSEVSKLIVTYSSCEILNVRFYCRRIFYGSDVGKKMKQWDREVASDWLLRQAHRNIIKLNVHYQESKEMQ